MTAASLRFDDSRLQRMEQAALWLQRMQSAAPDERVVEAWLDWCQRDPLNQQAFDEIAAVWELSGRLPGAPRAAAAAATTKPRRWALVASLAGLGLAISVGAWWAVRPERAGVLTSEFSSPIGINSTQTLADGSVLELGAGTRVTVVIAAHERRVELHEGELFVTVHHEPERPFSVDVGRLQVIATGTAFNVLRTSERTTVTVAEGTVKALYEDQGATTPNVHVQSGQQLVDYRASNSFIVRQADPRDATAWRNGLLHFRNEPLSEVIATINRYAARKIVIEDPGVKALSFTGTARADGIKGWLQGLPHIFQVVVVERADGSQLISLRPGARPD